MLVALLAAPAVWQIAGASSATRPAPDGGAVPACGAFPPSQTLSLSAFVSRVLCQDPRSAAAWSRVQMQAAATALAKADYYPRVELGASFGYVDESARYDSLPGEEATLRGANNQQALSFGWLLYDFGLRAAQLSRERARLQAALSAQEDTVQTVLSEAIAAYFAAVQADRALAAQREAEGVAQRSLRVVEDQLAAGIATEADRLQAKTALARATVGRVSAESASRAAQGVLAIMMGLPPQTTLAIEAGGDEVEEAPQLGDLAGHLIERAVQGHPRVAAALAQMQAARADLEAATASGWPRLSLAASAERSENPAGRALVQQTVQAGSIGVQLSVPLFDGFARQSRIKGAQAVMESRAADLHAAEQQITRDLWQRYLAVQSGVQDVQASRALLDTARESYQLAAGRYRSGVGTVVEMLMAQADLAAARAHQEAAISALRAARLQLAVLLGEAGLHPQAEIAVEPSGRERGVASSANAVAMRGAPRILSLSPSPVPGGQGARALTIRGENFGEGAVVHLQNNSESLSYPARVPIVFDPQHLWVWAPIGCAADWTAQVESTDGRRSEPYAFKVVGGC